MKGAVLVIAAILFVLYALFEPVWLHGQSVQYKAAESYMPEVVTIKRTLPDKARLCVEPRDGGLLVCKPIGEVRWWFDQSTKK